MPKTGARISASIRNGVLRSGPDPHYADGDDASWLEVDWPALTHSERIGGATINFVDTGRSSDSDKPVLLFLHGLSGLWQNWLLTIPALMGEYRCIAPDLPGFGASTLDQEDITIRGYAGIIDAFCQRLGVRRVAVIGNSMGGFIAAELALAFPTRVEKLVLVSAAGLSIEYVRPEPLLAFGYFVTKSRVQSLIPYGRAITRPGLRRLALQMFVRYPEKLSLPLAWELVQGTGRAALLHALKALTSYSFRDRLTEIEIPVLIVWGENDLLVPVGDAARFEKLIGSNARSVVFEDTGHGPMIERPTRFNELLRAFLAETPSPERAIPGIHAGAG